MRLATPALATLLAACTHTSFFTASYRAEPPGPAPLAVEVHDLRYAVRERLGDVLDSEREPMRITLRNRGDRTLRLDWNRSSFVDDAGQSCLVLPAALPRREWQLSQEPTALPPGAAVEALVVPTAGRAGERPAGARQRLLLAVEGSGEPLVVPVTLDHVTRMVLRADYGVPPPDDMTPRQRGMRD